MAYEDYEVSVEGSKPVELYTLAIGATTVWYMHNSQPNEEISYLGNTHIAAIVGRGNITGGQDNLQITLPASHAFASKFVTISPGQLGTITIYRYQRTEGIGDTQVIYKGVVRSVSFGLEGAQATLTVIPINATFDKTIPDRTFQAQCNHVLFDTKCQVSTGSWLHTNTVSAAALNTITVTGLSAKGSGWATGGYVAYSTYDYRLILDHTGDICTLVLPFYETVVGNSVTVYAGCDHSAATCNSKFSNIPNFGGCPYVPSKNIFATGL